MTRRQNWTAVLRIIISTSLITTALAACTDEQSPEALAEADLSKGRPTSTPAAPPSRRAQTETTTTAPSTEPAPTTTTTTAPAPAPAPAPAVAPTITSFTSSAPQVGAGEKVTLSWQVQGADKVEIRPNIGTVTTSSVTTSPLVTTTYQLVATKDTLTTTKSLVVSVLPTASNWQVTERPPTLVNPRMIDVSKVGLQQMPAFALHCGGQYRQVTLGDSEDALIYMSTDTPLRHPLHVTGGRNVRIVGIHIELETQPGCGVGQLPNYVNGSNTQTIPNANIHPRIPGGIAMRLQQSHTTFIEGVYLDLRGHETDCFVSRNKAGVVDGVAKAQRDFIVQNSYCSGIEGLGQSKIGDGVHGDLWQNQGPNEIVRRLVFENVSTLSSMEGIVLLGSTNGYRGAAELVLRRFNYAWDPRYVGDDAYEDFGLALAGSTDKVVYEDVYIDNYWDGGDYVLVNEQRAGVSNATNVVRVAGIFSGVPPVGDFALPQKTGVNYVSPHGGVP